VSAYIAAALEERSKLAAVSGYVTQMLSDSGAVAPPPGSPEPPG
jgi:hypothetical protein